MVTNNCKGCTERHVGCHSTCKSYLKFVEENNKEKAALRKQTESMSLNSDGTMFSGIKGQRNMRPKHKGGKI